MDIRQLATKPEQIDTVKCLPYLQKLTNVPNDKSDAEHLLHHIAAIIHKETGPIDSPSPVVNQVLLNVSFRCYYQLLHRHNLEDTFFGDLPSKLNHEHEIVFFMMHAVLLTEHWRHLNAQHLEAQCTKALIEGVEANSSSLLAILKVINLLVKKQPTLEVQQLELDHFYHCMQQSQVGIREETLTLFNHCCRDAKRAFKNFQILVTFWPWTNRNKYYLLSCILNTCNLLELLEYAEESKIEFFAGLRMSLSYKSLLAASQYLVKSLSNQDSKELLELAVELLTCGTLAEIQNFHAQWFSRIKQQDALFELLQMQPEIVALLDYKSSTMVDSVMQYRFILIFSMFSKQLFSVSKLYFFKISTEMLTNCYNYELDAQLLIFRFLVNNLANFAIEDCLDFLYNFMHKHRSIESAQFRNTMLGKLPTIINHISKHFSKALNTSDGNTLSESIKRYFVQLQQLVEQDVHSEVYQPKIFALKLFEILYGSLYATQVAKNAKNCSTQQNQQLGSYLREQSVFDEANMSNQLLKLLDDAQGFDDAQALVVKLLQQLANVSKELIFSLCKDYCSRSAVDECSLATLHVQVAVQTHKSDEDTQQLYEYALTSVKAALMDVEQDALMSLKNGKHLFGYLNVINEVVRARQVKFVSKTTELLQLLEKVLNMVLNMLNLANLRSGQLCTAADFQDMDESLQLLVKESAYKCNEETLESSEECRKFLLMSFWLTLKATCDLATSLGCLLVKHATSAENCELKQCFYINVAVLTRCRHKGAIEAAGVSIGALTKCITDHVPNDDERFEMLHSCLAEELLVSGRQVSTTRRGAGFSIMFLHIVKNDDSRNRPILKRAMALILRQLNAQTPALKDTQKMDTSANHDRLEALTLHYLCVLAKDTELRNAMSKYYNEILLTVIANIDDPEWTVCNAALQLFGALVPKLVGQRQATEFETPPAWEPSELSYSELARMLPQTCQHILDYCAERNSTNISTRSIILFLCFLSKVEHLRKHCKELEDNALLSRFRELSWQLLQHECEQVRKLAATCFVRAHEFRSDLPVALLAIAKLLTQVREENFFQSLVYVLHDGVLKLQHESQHVCPPSELINFMRELTSAIGLEKELTHFTLYTHAKLLDLLILLSRYEKMAENTISELVALNVKRTSNQLGDALWREKLRLLDIR